MKHDLKIQHECLMNLISGVKRVEIRRNDRDYQTGDILSVYDKDIGYYLFQITHIHSGLGMLPDYVALSVASVGEEKP